MRLEELANFEYGDIVEIRREGYCHTYYVLDTGIFEPKLGESEEYLLVCAGFNNSVPIKEFHVHIRKAEEIRFYKSLMTRGETS